MSSRETVWKIAEGVSPRLSGGKRRPNRDSFDPSWLLSEPRFGTYPEFPNSFGEGILRTSPYTISRKLNFRYTEFYEVEVAGRRSYVTLADSYRRPACSVALRWVSRIGGNGIVDAHPRLGAITP
jgi:hypothetical protein